MCSLFFLVGNFTTHAVVYARLITQGVDYGVHPFIVQLRSLENYYPLPGKISNEKCLCQCYSKYHVKMAL